VIAYFDTSALVPLLVDEAGSVTAARMWDGADRVASVRLVYAEARAALAMAARLERFPRRVLAGLVRDLDGLYAQLDRVEIDDDLVRRAGDVAERFGLRGYDAVHLAAAERLTDDEVVLVAGDRELCEAAGSLGLAVSDTSP
jgi:hypothetical protein